MDFPLSILVFPCGGCLISVARLLIMLPCLPISIVVRIQLVGTIVTIGTRVLLSTINRFSRHFFHLLSKRICRFRVILSFPLIAIFSLTRPVQLFAARPHRTRLIDFYTERDEMCLPKPPERFKQRSTRRCAFV